MHAQHPRLTRARAVQESFVRFVRCSTRRARTTSGSPPDRKDSTSKGGAVADGGQQYAWCPGRSWGVRLSSAGSSRVWAAYRAVAVRKNDMAIGELLRVGGCMCIRNYAGQNAIDVRKTEELHMLSSELPVAVVGVQSIGHTYTMRIENVGNSAPSARCEECEP